MLGWEGFGKGQSARTCQPSLFFGSISKQQLSNAVVLALTFSYSPHYFFLFSCPYSHDFGSNSPHFHDFGSFSPHFSVLVPIALTLDFGSYSPHFSVLFQIALTSWFWFKQPSLSVLVLIALTFQFWFLQPSPSWFWSLQPSLFNFGSYSPHSCPYRPYARTPVPREPLLVERNGRKKSLGTPKVYPGPTVREVLYPMVPSKLSSPHFSILVLIALTFMI